MTTKFLVHSYGTGKYMAQDFSAVDEAIAFVEASGADGSVVKFCGSRNMPFCLPEIVFSAVALWTYENGIWYSRAIHGGTADILSEERPH